MSITRRSLLSLPLAAAPLFSAAPDVRIRSVETFYLPVNRRGGWTLVRVHTDAGITGIGDASHSRRPEDSRRFIQQFAEQMKGRRFTDIEYLRKLAAPLVRPHDFTVPVALSGIEQALWDIAGQAFGVPTYSLFGGKLFDAVRNYANINRATSDRSPSDFARLAAGAVRDGFTAIKLASYDGFPKDPAGAEEHIRKGTECIAAVRQAIGPKNDLLVDAHSNFTRERGLQLARDLEKYDLHWLEEVSPGIPDLAAINRAAKMRTAGGESLFGVKEFFEYAAGGAADILMPDVKYCGGMLELKKISAMAEGAGLPIAPHGPASPVGNIAAAHVCVTLPNFHLLEFAYGECDWRSELVDPPEQLTTGGILTLSERPGFGVKLNDKLLKQRAV